MQVIHVGVKKNLSRSKQRSIKKKNQIKSKLTVHLSATVTLKDSFLKIFVTLSFSTSTFLLIFDDWLLQALCRL